MDADLKVVRDLETLSVEVARLTGSLNSLGRVPQRESREATWGFKVSPQIGRILDCLTNPECPRFLLFQRALGAGKIEDLGSALADEVSARALRFDSRLKQFGAALDDFHRQRVEGWGEEIYSLDIWRVIPDLIREGREFTSTLGTVIEGFKTARPRRKAKATPKRRPVVKIQAKRRGAKAKRR